MPDCTAEELASAAADAAEETAQEEFDDATTVLVDAQLDAIVAAAELANCQGP